MVGESYLVEVLLRFMFQGQYQGKVLIGRRSVVSWSETYASFGI